VADGDLERAFAALETSERGERWEGTPGLERPRREQRRARLRLGYRKRVEWLVQAKRLAARAFEASPTRRASDPARS
jgi:hypothetical protein